MALKKPLVLNGGQLQRLQTGDTLDPSGLFDPTSNLGSLSGLATNGITVHNGTAYTTVSLTAPASGMTITNPDGIAGSPTFAFTAELSALLGLGTGMVAKTAAGTLAARTVQGVTNQTSVTNGDGVAGNPTIGLASNPVIPGVAAMTVPTGATVDQPVAPTVGMVRYNTTSNKFEFYQAGAWVNYGTSNTVGTVTSVDVSLPTSVFSASSGAITSSGTISFTFNTQTANTVFAGPSTGAAAAPTFRALVAADIPNLPWSKITSGTPTTLAGYGITDAVLSSTTVAAGTGLTGGGVLGNLGGTVTISMPSVGTPVVNQFVKITTDAQGRVSGTTAVGASDITTALGYTPVNKAGDTMTGNLAMGGTNTVTGLPLSPVSPSDAASKAYVDNQVASGTTWRDPVLGPNLLGVSASEPTSGMLGATRSQWIAYGTITGNPWTGGVTVASGDILEWHPAPLSTWVKIGTLAAGARFVVAGQSFDVPLHTSLFSIDIRPMDLIQFAVGATDPTLAASWTEPSADNLQAVLYTASITGATVTTLATGTTYTASVKVNGTSHALSHAGVTGETFQTLINDINTQLSGIAVASFVAGHIHIAGVNATDRVVITDGATLATALFYQANAGMVIRGGVVPGTTVLVSNPLSSDNGRTGLFSGGANGTHTWIEIGGPAAINAGVGLSYDGNTMNVNLGAGIAQLPTDEVGVDLYNVVSNALILTTDGTTRSTVTGAQLALLLNGSTLVQGASGLNVAAGGITGTELNVSVAGAGLAGGGGAALSVNVDNSSIEINVDTLRIKAAGVTPAMLSAAVAGLGLVNTGTSLDINVGTGALQTTGDVLDIKAGGVTNAMLVNSSTTFAGTSGTPTAVSLGGTLTIAAGTGISTTASAGTVTVALNATLDQLTDVTITTPATGDIIYRNAGGQFVNAAPGATSGVQPYDTTLTALAGLTATPGLVVESGVDAFVTRVITGTAGRVVVTNGDGIAGDPTIDLASGVVTPGTYTSVTVDTYGRVTAGTAIELNTQVAMVNSNAGSLVIGTPVYVITAGHVDKADAGATSTTRTIGLVADLAIATTATGNVAVSGILTATTGQWDAVTGQTGGLTAGAVYYLSDGTSGTLTTTAPTLTGSYIAPIGIALSATQIKIQVDPTIQL